MRQLKEGSSSVTGLRPLRTPKASSWRRLKVNARILELASERSQHRPATPLGLSCKSSHRVQRIRPERESRGRAVRRVPLTAAHRRPALPHLMVSDRLYTRSFPARPRWHDLRSQNSANSPLLHIADQGRDTVPYPLWDVAWRGPGVHSLREYAGSIDICAIQRALPVVAPQPSDRLASAMTWGRLQLAPCRDDKIRNDALAVRQIGDHMPTVARSTKLSRGSNPLLRSLLNELEPRKL